MRIIAGSKRGMKLLSPKAQVSRPITDRVKESLFSVLYKYDLPSGKIVADVFSGVGSLGLESLSRGAEFVTFVEKDIKVADVLKKNIAKAGFEEKSKVVQGDAFSIGAGFSFARPGYDLIFIDPPYAVTKEAGEGSDLHGLFGILHEQVATNGIVVVRTHKRTFLPGSYGRFSVIDRRVWGNMAVTLLQMAEK